MDMADQYDDLKIIAIGAVDTARQVVEYDMEMRNRVSEIYVPLMDKDEIKKILDKGEQLLNFSMTRAVQKEIVDYSSGLASVCHQFGLYICNASGITETLPEKKRTNDEELKSAAKMYLDNSSDTLKAVFEKAFGTAKVRKYDNRRLILQALQSFDQDGATIAELFRQIRTLSTNYPKSNLSAYLKQLTTDERGALLWYNPITAKYSFSDPIYRAFATSLFGKSDSNHETLYGFRDIALRDMMDGLSRDLMANLALKNVYFHRVLGKSSSDEVILHDTGG